MQRLSACRVAEPGHVAVDLGARLRDQAVIPQQLGQYDVTHAKPQGGHVHARDHLQQVVIAAASADGAQLLSGIPQLEDDTGIVGETADDREVHIHVVGHTQVFQMPQVGGEFGDPLADARHVSERPAERVDSAQLDGGEDPLDRGRLQPELLEAFLQSLSRLALQLIHHLVHRRQRPLRHAEVSKDGGEHAPVRNTGANLGGVESGRSDDVDRRRQQLGVRQHIRFAQDVHVELEVLAQAAALLSLVAIELWHREPANRLAQRPGSRAHHAGERGSHLRPQGDLPAAFVFELVELLNDLLARLARVDLEWLERRPVILLETVPAGHFTPHAHQIRTCGQILRIEVPKTR